MIKTYSEAVEIPTFEERFEYLKLDGCVGDFTFGGHRYLNQALYKSEEWKQIRRKIIMRDSGCDLADPDHQIFDALLIHHINPITARDISERTSKVFDPENLICVSFHTHNALHYGSDSDSFDICHFTERSLYDTCPWR